LPRRGPRWTPGIAAAWTLGAVRQWRDARQERVRNPVDRVPGHAWDYAAAVGHEIHAPEPLCEYVLGLAREVIRPELRSSVGFNEPVDVAADAGALEQLVAFTGRNPG